MLDTSLPLYDAVRPFIEEEFVTTFFEGLDFSVYPNNL